MIFLLPISIKSEENYRQNEQKDPRFPKDRGE